MCGRISGLKEALRRLKTVKGEASGEVALQGAKNAADNEKGLSLERGSSRGRNKLRLMRWMLIGSPSGCSALSYLTVIELYGPGAMRLNHDLILDPTAVST